MGRMSEPEAIWRHGSTSCWARRGAARSRAGACSSPPAVRASRSTRSASSATARPAGWASRSRPRRAGAGRRVTLLAANLSVPAPVGVEVVETPTAADARARGARARRRRRRHHGRRRRRLPARRARSTGSGRRTSDDLAGRRSSRRRTCCASSARGGRTGRCSSASPPTRGDRGLERAREKLATSASTSSSSTTWAATTSASTRRTTRSSSLTRDGRARASPRRRRRRSRRLSLDEVERLLAGGDAGAALSRRERAASGGDDRAASSTTSRAVVHAPDETLRLCVLCLVAEGHLIIEDFPGVGKTMLAKALARSLDVSLLADAVHARPAAVRRHRRRTSSTSGRTSSSSGPGPVFANLLLVDEINRASPKTQSALLEAMQERQVTVDGVTYRARAGRSSCSRRRTRSSTRAPTRCPRPSSTASRCGSRIGYPPLAEEAQMLAEQTTDPPLEALSPSPTRDEIRSRDRGRARRSTSRRASTATSSRCSGTRASSPRLALGASPRAGIALLRVAKARALAEGRDFVAARRRQGRRRRPCSRIG